MAERLRAEAPELLLVDPGGRKKLLGRVAGDGLVTLDRRPGLAAAAPRLGDKILRRTFVRELGLRFAPGSRGELAVTWPALLAAERIAAVPESPRQRPAPAAGPAGRDRARVRRRLRLPGRAPQGAGGAPPARAARAPARGRAGPLARLPVGERAAAFAALSE